METPASTHPADETLVSYGLGKLDETVADRVSKHLEECAPCRQRVADLSGDSFVGRLRQAQPQPAQPQPAQPVPRAKTLVEDVPQGGARSKVSEKQSSILGKLASSQDSDSSPESGSALPPELVDHPHYEVIRELGRGGMGVVYLARNKLMDRLEVLKLLSQEMLGKPERVERFLREIQAAAKLHHPNVVAAYTAFPLGKLLVFAMEYVEGDDLAKLVRARGPLPVLNACYFAYQTALGLQHAHERGMIHRDIKPGN
ncbi:MAG TPA: protein kinase, partial [Planctomycetaceae bacterium]|nr:protein kinase [Planctomycetaceae bacterium]